MAAAGRWAALPAVSGTAVDPNIARGGPFNLTRVIPCSQLLVAARYWSDWSGPKPLRRLGLLYTRSWRGGLIIRVWSPGGQAEEGRVSPMRTMLAAACTAKAGSNQSNAGG